MIKKDDDVYLTLNGVGEGLYKEKGSKFLAFAHHADNVDDIYNILASYKKKYYDARHHCYAWMLGPERKQFRVNDDGEPSGTAGKPILNQILSAGITDVVVVVVRWFGGTKLGTSGLIKAYKEASQEAIANAPKILKTIDETITATFSYPLLNEVMRICKDWQVAPNLHYEPSEIRLNCKIRKGQAKSFAYELSTIYGVILTDLQ